MSKLVECVPNFSEGRRPEVIREIVAEIAAVPGATVLDSGLDPDHNRAVVTFVGAPHAVREAAFRAIALAAQRIDLTKHKGEHPRLGAADVVPFVPLRGATMEDCVEIARTLGQEVAERLEIPVYLYEEAARRPERRNLADVRRGGFEGLREEIATDPARAPDFGPSRLHPTAGAVVIGARRFLIAMNVDLETSDLELGKAIAREVRESSGGLVAVKALGFRLKGRGVVQVSMNLTDPKRTSMGKVFRRVEKLARERGVRVKSTEVVGLVPEEAVVAGLKDALKLDRFGRKQVVEERVRESIAGPFELQPFLDDVASARPSPGGGSAAALAGAIAAAAAAKVVALTVARPRFAPVRERFEAVGRDIESARWDLLRLVEQDAAVYRTLVEARRSLKEAPADDADARRKRQEAVDEAALEAARVPLAVAERAVEVGRAAAFAAHYGNRNALADALAAVSLARGALEGAVAMVRVNLPGVRDAAESARMSVRADDLRAEADRLVGKVSSLFASENAPGPQS